jgi:molecular chaperone GrpE
MSKKKNPKQEKEETMPNAEVSNEVTPENFREINEQEIQEDDSKIEVVSADEVDALVELQKQIDEAKDKYVRLSAEFDNYRKRTQREKADLIRYGSEDAMKGILPLVDDFDRAIKHSENATDVEAIKQGLILIHGKFAEFLKSNGVKEIEAMGQVLDTDMHEAITKIPAPDENLKGKIVDVVEKGYMLNDKIIRFSKVVIGE